MRLVVTRPLEDAEQQAAQLKALGHEPSIHPLLEIVYSSLAPLRLNGVQALIATSRNALRGLSRNESFDASKQLPVYCVGQGTADLARRMQFSHVICGEGTAKDLVPLIADTAKPEAGALLYLTGQHLAFDLQSPLKAAGFALPRIVLYEAQEVDMSGAEIFARGIREGTDGVILMSQRTGAIFSDIVERFKLWREACAITCYCYSEVIAKTLKNIRGLTIAISSHPTEAQLMQLIGPAPVHGDAAFADLKDAGSKH